MAKLAFVTLKKIRAQSSAKGNNKGSYLYAFKVNWPGMPSVCLPALLFLLLLVMFLFNLSVRDNRVQEGVVGSDAFTFPLFIDTGEERRNRICHIAMLYYFIYKRKLA